MEEHKTIFSEVSRVSILDLINLYEMLPSSILREESRGEGGV